MKKSKCWFAGSAAAALFCLIASPKVVAEPPQATGGGNWVALPELTDEFNGATLDPTKWQKGRPGWTGRESTFDPANVYLTNGTLCLRSTAVNADDIRAACCQSTTASATSGCYYEASIKVSRLSMTSTFWLTGKYSEIDAMEQFGASLKRATNTQVLNMHVHYFPNGRSTDVGPRVTWKMPDSPTKAFHTYGMWWKDPRNVTYYFDGQEVGSIKTPGDFNESMNMLFTTEVFSKSDGRPTLESLRDPLRNTMYVDWVRSWRLVPASESKATALTPK